MFLNGILNNVDVWYGITKAEIQEFEDLDLTLLRKILQAPISTPKEAFHLELGLIPIGVLIKAKRINYLHYLISRKESEMISQFFWTQWHNPTKGDWTESVKLDLEDLNISMSLEEMKGKSQDSMKKIVKVKAIEYSLESLLKKKAKHSKMDKLDYSELKLASYFKLPGLNIRELRDIFKFRVRMSQFGENFRGNGENVSCPLCLSHIDTQNMMFDCPELKEKGIQKLDDSEIYTDNISVEAIKELSKILKMRKVLIEEKEEN